MIACPSCVSRNVGVHTLAQDVEERLSTYSQAFEVAVLGCAANGPGRAATPTSGSPAAATSASSTRTAAPEEGRPTS
jgi:4-hydroxy-3-methylbut-2-en-1-yl diphosphate synthase IspG/GcpE